MDPRAVAGIAVLVLLLLLRLFAARRIAARQGRFVWLMFVPTLMFGVAILWVSIQTFARTPILGVFIAATGVIYLAALVRFLTRLSRSVTASRPEDDLSAAMTEPMVDYMETMLGLLLVAGLVAVVGLIIWGVIQATQ